MEHFPEPCDENSTTTNLVCLDTRYYISFGDSQPWTRLQRVVPGPIPISIGDTQPYTRLYGQNWAYTHLYGCYPDFYPLL